LFSFSNFLFSINSFILLKLIEWFNLISYKYSWSGIGSCADLTKTIAEMDSISASFINDDFRNFILSPIKLKPVWYDENSGSITCDDLSKYSSNVPTTSVLNQWNQFQAKLVSHSAVTLMTESTINMDLNYTFTERTVFSVLGLTFPIWVGNFGQAEQAKAMGFDIFSDVIDHSYQYKKTLLERCYYAIADNLEILTNFELAKQTRISNFKRLIDNRSYLMNGGFLEWTNQQITELFKETGVDVSCLNPSK
jgi:hypothetical protein